MKKLIISLIIAMISATTLCAAEVHVSTDKQVAPNVKKGGIISGHVIEKGSAEDIDLPPKSWTD